MSGVIIGVDPHKASATIEVRDEREVLRATGRFGADTGGYRAMLRYCRQWPARTWAVEGANGTGRPLSARLLADGEQVVDVPAKLAGRIRVFDTGHARKSDAHDAHAIVMVALRTRGLRQLQVDEDLAVLRLLADRAGRVVTQSSADPQPAAPAARRAHRRRRETGPVLVQGPSTTGHRAPAGPARPHPPPARRRADR
jgi:transposase